MVTCQSCGAQNDAEHAFCSSCGSALSQTCPSCATDNQPTSKFCHNCGSALGGEVSAEGVGDAVSPSASSGERRLVSVVFADLVGFTTFSEDRDPEDVRTMLTAYYERCREIIGRFGGTTD
ncbi:MAG: zinc-ribbon domain-containing protein, partial [Acidimicrobiia bacterium]